jgi:hypothetical protein
LLSRPLADSFADGRRQKSNFSVKKQLFTLASIKKVDLAKKDVLSQVRVEGW